MNIIECGGGESSPVTITPLKWSYYIFLGDEKIATVENQNNTNKYIFHLDDHLGGSNLDIDVNGDVLQITDYLPYGNQRITQRNGDYKNKYGFIGKEKDYVLYDAERAVKNVAEIGSDRDGSL
ncbi:MAG: hypothetical protein PHH70_01775 [Candidatus Gracilibacteria bacterium]|nr:hypothetical protein [Candidatus Gracilibacteria bacterium]